VTRALHESPRTAALYGRALGHTQRAATPKAALANGALIKLLPQLIPGDCPLSSPPAPRPLPVVRGAPTRPAWVMPVGSPDQILEQGTSHRIPQLQITKAVEAMSKLGGTALKTSLSKEPAQELQEAPRGRPRNRPLTASVRTAGTVRAPGLARREGCHVRVTGRT
jgi:hypothetical protein